MDCDQVLWTGRCGEGHPLVIDEPRRALLHALLDQRDLGTLLCLCSNIPEETVWAAFENNTAMPLRRDDIVAAAFGPEGNAALLRNLANELGLGLSSFIFLHAEPDECAELEEECSEVLTLQVPADPEDIPAWLKNVWAFDRFNGSGNLVSSEKLCADVCCAGKGQKQWQ
jgi:predicted enzyme involved in methoxymalonyl-ACP biosynthesis